MQLPLFGMPDHVQHPNWLAEGNNPLVGDDLLRYSDVSAIMALAQHHGIPTRLLDWTRNPMAAAFFAVEFIEPQKDENLVVWALHKQRAKDLTVDGVSFPDSPGQGWKIDCGINIFRPSTRDNPFLAAQSGLFTTISNSGIFFMKSQGNRPSLEEFVSLAQPAQNVLRKIVLSHEHAADLIEILRRERVSRSVFMPTMDNVARDVMTKWRQGRLA